MTDDTESVPLDVSIVDALRVAIDKRDYWDSLCQGLRSHIEEQLGERTLGTVAGNAVVRYSHVRTRRLDRNKLMDRVDPAVLAECYSEMHSRRFTWIKSTEDGGQ